MPTVLLATFNLMPEGEPGGHHLVTALAERGLEGRWVCWDDPAVDWAAADVVATRSTWDYYRRLPAFLIATVDKFAALPWRGQAGAFFGHVDRADATGAANAPERGARGVRAGPWGRGRCCRIAAGRGPGRPAAAPGRRSCGASVVPPIRLA